MGRGWELCGYHFLASLCYSIKSPRSSSSVGRLVLEYCLFWRQGFANTVKIWSSGGPTFFRLWWRVEYHSVILWWQSWLFEQSVLHEHGIRPPFSSCTIGRGPSTILVPVGLITSPGIPILPRQLPRRLANSQHPCFSLPFQVFAPELPISQAGLPVYSKWCTATEFSHSEVRWLPYSQRHPLLRCRVPHLAMLKRCRTSIFDRNLLRTALVDHFQHLGRYVQLEWKFFLEMGSVAFLPTNELYLR